MAAWSTLYNRQSYLPPSGAAAKAGGQGDRYTIAVCGQERYLFFERSSNISGNTIGKWYVEVEVPVQ